MRTYQEITDDKGYEKKCWASNNWAAYILTSARAHDMYHNYIERYSRNPTAQWFNRHFRFRRIR